MEFLKSVLLFTFEHFPAFLVAGGLATLFFSWIFSRRLIELGVKDFWRGVIYTVVTLCVSLPYEATSGVTDLFDGSGPMYIVITLWIVSTLILGILSVKLWALRPRKSVN
jgi:hypothetical protein